jgi:glutamate/tyrosine decarboxylase-like PLP-dependent enzyme
MIDFQRDIRQRPVWQAVPEPLERRFFEGPPAQGIGTTAALKEFEDLVLPYPVGNTHPRFWGWATGTGSPTGMLADMLAAGLNPVAGVFNDSASRVESQLLAWMKSAFGFPPEASGIITSGGSVANLVGLTVARDAKVGANVGQDGLVGARRPILYASREIHSSVPKAAKILGLGEAGVHLIPVDDCCRIRLAELASAIERDRASGCQPFAVVGTAGTINTGAVDDLPSLADLAARDGLWFHVDGAFGAIAALSPEARGLVAGVERADSLAFDFHKWMHAPYEAGCVLVRDPEAHRRSFTVGADYLRPLDRGVARQPDNSYLKGPQLSRGFKALKVWLTLKEHGFEKFGRLVAQNVWQARYLGRLVDASPLFVRVAPVTLNVVAFRHEPPDLDKAVAEEINREVLMRMQEEGTAVPSATVLNDRFTLRVCVCNHRSRMEDFDFFMAEAETTLLRVRADLGLDST